MGVANLSPQDWRPWIAMSKTPFPGGMIITKWRIEKYEDASRKELVKTLIWSATLYCAETWTLRKEDIKRFEAFEMRIWRKTKKISWTEHISNEVLKLLEEERSLLTIIRTRQRNWMDEVSPLSLYVLSSSDGSFSLSLTWIFFHLQVLTPPHLICALSNWSSPSYTISTCQTLQILWCPPFSESMFLHSIRSLSKSVFSPFFSWDIFSILPLVVLSSWKRLLFHCYPSLDWRSVFKYFCGAGEVFPYIWYNSGAGEAS